jgi:hypothetical protein
MSTWNRILKISDVAIGDVVMVKLDAYDKEIGEMHNGRICEVVDIMYGNVIVKSIDQRLPKLSRTYHSPYMLLKEVL